VSPSEAAEAATPRAAQELLASGSQQQPSRRAAEPSTADDWAHSSSSQPGDADFQFVMPSAAMRRQLFQAWDINGNGLLSLAEIDKAVVECWPAFDHKPALLRAYAVAKNPTTGWIDARGFRRLLQLIVYFNRLWEVFELIDADHDRRMDLQEFRRGCAHLGEALSEEEAALEWAELHRKGAGRVLFDAFCVWMEEREAEREGEAIADTLAHARHECVLVLTPRVPGASAVLTMRGEHAQAVCLGRGLHSLPDDPKIPRQHVRVERRDGHWCATALSAKTAAFVERNRAAGTTIHRQLIRMSRERVTDLQDEDVLHFRRKGETYPLVVAMQAADGSVHHRHAPRTDVSADSAPPTRADQARVRLAFACMMCFGIRSLARADPTMSRKGN
jgi:Ca2+-binding EF-hand superfamily protein